MLSRTILVLGATGMLGQPVAHSLQQAGFQVRVLSRDCQKANRLFDRSFEILAGDPLHSGCLQNAMRGCTGVHISLPGEAEQAVAESVAQQAASYGIERITYISGATVAEENRWFPMINRKFLAEQAIRESGVAYTIFCPTWFMEGLPLFVMQGRAAVLGRQPCPYHWVAADDYARMVVAAYGLPPTSSLRCFVLGPQPLRMHEALQRYCAAFHPEIKQVSTMPLWLVKLLATLTRNQGLQTAGDMMGYFDRVGEGQQATREQGPLGAPETTLDQWLHIRKARLSSPAPVLA